MTPVRLVILAILFYIGYRLFRSVMRSNVNKKERSTTREKAQEQPVEDVLVEDPVCHTLIPKHQAIRLRVKEKTYYFCSEKCCDTFTENQEGEV